MWKTYWEGGNLQAKRRVLRRNQAWWHLDLGLLTSRTMRINFCCLSHLSWGILCGRPRKLIHSPCKIRNRKVSTDNFLLKKLTKKLKKSLLIILHWPEFSYMSVAKTVLLCDHYTQPELEKCFNERKRGVWILRDNVLSWCNPRITLCGCFLFLLFFG